MNENKTYIGFSPRTYQKAVIDHLIDAKGTKRTVTVKSRRQVGKSLLIENILLYYAINYAKSKNALLSPTWAQAKKVFKEIVNAIESSNIIKSSNASDLIIKLINRVRNPILFSSTKRKPAWLYSFWYPMYR